MTHGTPKIIKLRWWLIKKLCGADISAVINVNISREKGLYFDPSGGKSPEHLIMMNVHYNGGGVWESPARYTLKQESGQ